MASIVSTDFTSLDGESVKGAMIKFAQENYGNEGWTDFNEDQFALAFVEMFAFGLDLGFYQINALVKETIVSQLTREQNLRNIAKTLDYQVPSAGAATGTVQCTFAPTLLPYTLSSTFKFSTNDGSNARVVFQPIADTLITAGGPIDINVVEGEGIYAEAVALSSGAPDQSYSLDRTPLIDGTLFVFVGGILWSAVTNFASAGPLDLVYLTQTDELGVTTLTFGDGISGLVPAMSAAITASYKVGGGTRGNVAKNTINTILTPGNVVLTVNNLAKMDNGKDVPTIAESQQAIPASLSVLKRAVTGQDYASLALNVAGVAKASSEVNSLNPNEINLFLAPSGGGDASIILKNSVAIAYQKSKMLTARVNIGNAFYPSLVLAIDALILPTAKQADVVAKIRETIMTDLAFDSVDFGGALRLQSLYLLLNPSNIPGLSAIIVRQVQLDAEVRTKFLAPNTGNATFPYVSTSSDIGTFTWEITITGTAGHPTATIVQKVRGVVADLSDTTLTDAVGTYVNDVLVGDGLIPNEDDGTSFAITGNTDTQISVASGLLAHAKIGDNYSISLNTYASQSLASTTIGPVPITGVTGAATGASVPVTSSSAFTAGDTVTISNSTPAVIYTGTISSIPDPSHVALSGTIPTLASSGFVLKKVLTLASVPVTDSTGIVGTDTVAIFDLTQTFLFTAVVSSVPDTTHLVLTGTIPTGVTLSNGFFIARVFHSGETVPMLKFAMVQGSSLVANGDFWFMDTTAILGDIPFRNQDIVQLDPMNLTIRPIGGLVF